MNYLILVRHGQSEWNLEKRFTGWVDVDLTENGKLEAEKAGYLIKKKNISIGQFRSTYGKLGILEGTIKTLGVEENDIIYTSGVSEIYPPDIPVAKVLNTNKKKDKLFQDVAVEILADTRNLYYVFVIH